VSQDERTGYESSALAGDSPATTPGDLGDQTMDPQQIQLSSDFSAASLCHRFRCRALGIQPSDDVPIAKAMDQMLFTQDRLKQRRVLRPQRVEAASLTTLTATGASQPMHLLVRLTGVVHLGQGLGIPLTGRFADLKIPGQVRHAFGHREPRQDASPLSSASTQDFEWLGLIEDGLDPQDHAGLVVHLDPVAGQSMLDPSPRETNLVVGQDLALKVAVKLTTEEGQDIFGAEGACGVL